MNVIDDEIRSIYFNKTWELNKLYEIDIVIGQDSTAYGFKQIGIYSAGFGTLKEEVISIEDGFHAFYNYGYAFKEKRAAGLFRCLIPAGSEYYKDITGLCVSNKIIILELEND